MEQSQYLAQALQAMSQPNAAPQSPTFNPQGMANLAKQAQAFHAANPDGSFIGHQLMQAGRNVMGAPGRAVDGLANLAQLIPGVGGSQPFNAVTAVPQQQAPMQPNGPLTQMPQFPQF
jgi:hypothetical protein